VTRQSLYNCHTCGRLLDIYVGRDGAETVMACNTVACRHRDLARLTLVGCWRTAWAHPEEIAAVQRTHDRQCRSQACIERREQRTIPASIAEGFEALDPKNPNDLRWARRALAVLGARIDEESPLTPVFSRKLEAHA